MDMFSQSCFPLSRALSMYQSSWSRSCGNVGSSNSINPPLLSLLVLDLLSQVLPWLPENGLCARDRVLNNNRKEYCGRLRGKGIFVFPFLSPVAFFPLPSPSRAILTMRLRAIWLMEDSSRRIIYSSLIQVYTMSARCTIKSAYGVSVSERCVSMTIRQKTVNSLLDMLIPCVS